MGSVKLQDRFGRSIDYVRLSVTDRCDLRCSYCMPKGFRGFEEPKAWLTFDEIERLLGIFVRLGTRRVRLTGGEPLLRRNLPELAQRLTALPGLQDLSLSTNATQLASTPWPCARRAWTASTSVWTRWTAPACSRSRDATACSLFWTA